MKLFSWSLDVLAPCCDVIISTLGQKDSNLYMMYKVLKSGTINNFGSKNFFWRKNFWILKHRSSLWRHYSKTGTIRADLTSEMRFSTPWNCKFWSLIQLATLQKSYLQGYLSLLVHNRSFLTQFSITAS